MTKANSGETNMKTRIGMSTTAFLLLLVLCGTGFGATAGPDAAGYTATDQATYSFENITSTGVRLLAGTDDGSAVVTLGFNFRFYGQDYTSVCISTNGLVAFGSCNIDFANVDLTSSAPSGDARIAAPFWTDLNFSTPGSDAVYYQVLGAAPSRRLVVQWNAAFPLNGKSGATFQASFHEGTNQIGFQYVSVGAGGNGSVATVGIRDAGGPANNRFIQWSYRAPVLGDTTALLFTPGGATATEYEVKVTVAPPSGGTVSGAGKYPAGSTVTLRAFASPGYRFTQWTGNAGTFTANPLTLTVDRARNVIANFVKLNAAITASVTARTGPMAARVWTVQLSNSGTDATTDTRLTGVTVTPVKGTGGCTTPPGVSTALPLDYGSLAAGGSSASRPITMNFGGCAPTTQYSVQLDFDANGGAYSSFTKLVNQAP